MARSAKAAPGRCDGRRRILRSAGWDTVEVGRRTCCSAPCRPRQFHNSSARRGQSSISSRRSQLLRESGRLQTMCPACIKHELPRGFCLRERWPRLRLLPRQTSRKSPTQYSYHAHLALGSLKTSANSSRTLAVLVIERTRHLFRLPITTNVSLEGDASAPG